ncbi:enoyl-CoA hydratase-related protein [Bacillus sp. FJAT-50079]|uniref:enoyl-CoA hydratase-related protein n=1 Tax=Bacillus sp. FJAT-50079 TaxID=2833577 RepID=UPI001BCA06D7|nr:enoyl-CoA hydratase-related protein [Bacillus sp. FJAT-50079]MBS4210751.1 enoyl-CoA hydratase/isomerase family protein [Bacillus sp. FJAT-50079]
MYETVLFEVSDSVARLTLNRPNKLNSFNEKMISELRHALKEARKSAEIRAILLTGAGRAFCAGQDLASVDEQADHGEMLRQYYNPLIEEIVSCEKPVIAAVNGVAAGAGFSLALAADFRIVSEKASFIQAFIHVGLVPDSGSTYFLPRLVGNAKALELMTLGEKIHADEAKELGIATKLISIDQWDEEIHSFAKRAAMIPTKAFALMKQNLQQSWELSLSALLEKEAFAQRVAGLTADHKEGVQAFLEKRKPDFQGK